MPRLRAASFIPSLAHLAMTSPSNPQNCWICSAFALSSPQFRQTLGKNWTQVASGYYPTRSFNFLGDGISDVWADLIFENHSVMPRTFVVRNCAVQTTETSEIRSQLDSIDLRQTATLDGWDPILPHCPRSRSSPGPAAIRSYNPNEVRIDLDGHTAGLLVLTDPWYPGWVCRVDGNEVPIWKADYAFRGVMVPEGRGKSCSTSSRNRIGGGSGFR